MDDVISIYMPLHSAAPFLPPLPSPLPPPHPLTHPPHRPLQGCLTIKHEKINLSELVDDVIDICMPLAKKKVKLLNCLADGLPPVLGDGGRIIQVWSGCGKVWTAGNGWGRQLRGGGVEGQAAQLPS